MQKALIIEGPNSCGKDVFISRILEYCPYYKIHYASSNIIQEIKGKEDLIPLVGYVTFSNIYDSIIRDFTNYSHIQYRSLLSNLIYNEIYRPEANLSLQDRQYLDHFLLDKYNENFTFWINTFDDAYLNKYFERNKSDLYDRVRHRDKEFYNLININKMYTEEAEKMKNNTAYKFKVVHTVGTGTFDIFNDIDKAIKDVSSKFYYNPIVVVDTYYLVRHHNMVSIPSSSKARFVYIANTEEECKNIIDNTYFKYIPEEKCRIITNSARDILNYDFFTIYVMSNIAQKTMSPTLYITSDNNKYFVEKKVGMFD